MTYYTEIAKVKIGSAVIPDRVCRPTTRQSMQIAGRVIKPAKRKNAALITHRRIPSLKPSRLIATFANSSEQGGEEGEAHGADEKETIKARHHESDAGKKAPPPEAGGVFVWTPYAAALSVVLFVAAGIAEIAGGWLVWQTIRAGKSPWYDPRVPRLLPPSFLQPSLLLY